MCGVASLQAHATGHERAVPVRQRVSGAGQAGAAPAKGGGLGPGAQSHRLRAPRRACRCQPAPLRRVRSTGWSEFEWEHAPWGRGPQRWCRLTPGGSRPGSRSSWGPGRQAWLSRSPLAACLGPPAAPARPGCSRGGPDNARCRPRGSVRSCLRRRRRSSPAAVQPPAAGKTPACLLAPLQSTRATQRHSPTSLGRRMARCLGTPRLLQSPWARPRVRSRLWRLQSPSDTAAAWHAARCNRSAHH